MTAVTLVGPGSGHELETTHGTIPRPARVAAPPSTCYIATTMPDGSPQLTQTWVDTDGEHVLVNSEQGFRKVRNVEHEPRVAVADPDNPQRYDSPMRRMFHEQV